MSADSGTVWLHAAKKKMCVLTLHQLITTHLMDSIFTLVKNQKRVPLFLRFQLLSGLTVNTMFYCKMDLNGVSQTVTVFISLLRAL